MTEQETKQEADYPAMRIFHASACVITEYGLANIPESDCTCGLYAMKQSSEHAQRYRTALEWLESKNTLHQSVDILYVVDGYQLEVHHDGDMLECYRGETLLEAIEAAIARSALSGEEKKE